MTPSNPLVRHQLDDLEIGAVAVETKLDDRSDGPRAPGIGSPPFSQPGIRGKQLIDIRRAALDSDAMLDFGHGR